MRSKGCLDCKHKSWNYPEPMKCNQGNDDLFNKWWAENGHRKSVDGTINDPACFEAHKTSIMLDELIEKTNSMLEKAD